MSLLRTIPVSGTVSTSATTWTTVVSCTISSNSGVLIKDIWLIGDIEQFGSTSTIGTFRGEHRAKRVLGTLSLVGSLVPIVTFLSGSDTAFQASQTRILADGDDLKLQVLPPSTSTIEWYGGFTAVQH